MSVKILISTENMPYEDWLHYRKLGIGGSDASVVCGINRYKSPVELWMEKTDQLPYQEAGEAAYWGTQLESLVRSEFTKRTGIEVKRVNQLLQSEEHPFMLANLDGICEHPDYGTVIFEAKTASAYKAGELSLIHIYINCLCKLCLCQISFKPFFSNTLTQLLICLLYTSNIRDTRQRERNKHHHDYMKGKIKDD